MVERHFEVVVDDEEPFADEGEVYSEESEPVDDGEFEVITSDFDVIGKPGSPRMLRRYEELEREYTRIFTDIPLDKERIQETLVKLKAELYALIKTILWIKEKIENEKKGAHKQFYSEYEKELRKEFKYNVCRAIWLAHKAVDYYNKTRDGNGIEELIDLAYTVKPQHDITKCRELQPSKPHLVREALVASGNIKYINNNVWRRRVNRHFKITQLTSIPKNKEYF